MSDSSPIVRFGDWLPDLPELDNPGLTEAKNVVPTDRVYKPYLPMNGSGDALSERPLGGISAFDSSGAAFFYTGTVHTLQQRSGTGWDTKNGASTLGTDVGAYWRFAQFDNSVIATNYQAVPQRITAGSAGDFTVLAASGAAPVARQVGVIGRFVMLGDTNETVNGAVQSRLQWSAIDDETNWPLPGTSTAVGFQAGEQFLNSHFGAVRSIVDGEQFGLILQRTGITRATYVGGNIVFQFDVIDRTRGALFANATVAVGNLVYFISGDGFFVTDGIQVNPVGDGKVDNYFADTVDTTYLERVYGAVDYANKCIYWVYPDTTATSGRPNRVLIFNYLENRWTRAEDQVEVIVSGLTVAITLDDLDGYFNNSVDIVSPSLDSAQWAGGNNVILGFNSTYQLGGFSGAAGTAIITGQEVEIYPGRFANVAGVKPLLTGDSPYTTVSLGRRNSLGDSVDYTLETVPNSRTGFADFRSEYRYHRPRVTIVGTFTGALGFEFQSSEQGA